MVMSLSETHNFEKGRIKALQDERAYIQKKTFTKWTNAFLEKAHLKMKDLFTDLADGKMLMKLLEIISGENLGRPNKGVLRVQKVENLNRCLQFLRTKMYFENIGAEDICDGNPRLILGLIWTIILRFQIQEIEIEVDVEEEGGEKRSAKDALLLWCQRKTACYRGVNITNFTASWRNGLGFNALIHAHRPDIIDYEALIPSEHMNNLNNAFNVADEKLGIHKILDAEDVDVDQPDEKVIITYVASYYHYFAKMETEKTGGNRIAKSLNFIEKMVEDYEMLMTSLLDWIWKTIQQLNNHNFPNSVEEIQHELVAFKQYRTEKKPPKYRKKENLKDQFFNIQAQLKANRQKEYVPPEGKLIHDIEAAWIHLEKVEHGREVALRDELIRKLANRFNRKAEICESWLNDMYQILEEKIECNNAAQAEAAIKKHEAISAEIMARKDQFKALKNLAKEVVQGKYHSKDSVQKKDADIMKKWQALLDKLESRRIILAGFNNMMNIFHEIESIKEELREIEPKMKADDYGKHLLAAEDYLHQYTLQEAQLHALAKRVHNLNRRSRQFVDPSHEEAKYLETSLDDLNAELERVNKLSNVRKKGLEVAKQYYQFLQDAEEEEQWVQEKIGLVKNALFGKDLNAASMMIEKHEALAAEIQGQFAHCEQVCASGLDLVNSGHHAKSDIGSRIRSLMDKWNQLQELISSRLTKLKDAIETQQYYADANEADSWMREKMTLVCSDEASAKALPSHHTRLDGEIKAFSCEINRLDQLSQLMTKAGSEHNISPDKMMLVENGEKFEEDDLDEEIVEVPQEVEVEEIVGCEVMQDIVETRKIPQVTAIYAYGGQGLKSEKEEEKEDNIVYLEFKTEVTEDVLNSIKVKYGQKGIDSLISNLKQFAKVDTCDDRVLVLCDSKHAEDVQKCVTSHYNKTERERTSPKETTNKYLINGGNDNLKEWLEFAFSHTSWSKNLEIEEGKLCLLGSEQMKREVEEAVQSMNHWYQEKFTLSSEEQQKADEVVTLVKNELPAVFIKQTREKIAVLSDNEENIEQAKYKVNMALGRIKITGRRRGHANPQAYNESSSDTYMSNDGRIDTGQIFPSLNFQSNQPTLDLAAKSYSTKEGLIAKVYLGDLTSLPVDCIVNAANELLSHDGGVALAISKAAGRDFDQEGKEYVQNHGAVPITQCCVTSSGKLHYKVIIHAVGPRWSDYRYNEKERCTDDLKKTIVNCLIEANKFKMASLAIPSLSSGIFGVPKPLCAQMYAQAVVEYSMTYGLQSVKEIHFVDIIPDMCQLIQSAFDVEFQM